MSQTLPASRGRPTPVAGRFDEHPREARTVLAVGDGGAPRAMIRGVRDLMKRTIGFAFFFCAALALTGCPGGETPAGPSSGGNTGTAAPAKPADAAKPAEAAKPKSDWTDVPGYEDVKVGQKYVYKMAAGMTSEWEVTAKGDSDYDVKMTSFMNGKELAAGTVTKMPFRVKNTGEAAKPAATEKASGKETLKAGGKDWDCEVFESEVAGQKMKQWRAKKFPFTIKSEMNGAVNMELSEVK
jgi:hypothetical protein